MLCVVFLRLYVCALKHMTSPPGPEVYKCVCGATIHRNQRITKNTLHSTLLQHNNTPSDKFWVLFFMTKKIFIQKEVFFLCLTVIHLKWNVIFRRESSSSKQLYNFQFNYKRKRKNRFIYLARARGSSSVTQNDSCLESNGNTFETLTNEKIFYEYGTACIYW